jgi:hypothetical protein
LKSIKMLKVAAAALAMPIIQHATESKVSQPPARAVQSDLESRQAFRGDPADSVPITGTLQLSCQHFDSHAILITDHSVLPLLEITLK